MRLKDVEGSGLVLKTNGSEICLARPVRRCTRTVAPGQRLTGKQKPVLFVCNARVPSKPTVRGCGTSAGCRELVLVQPRSVLEVESLCSPTSSDNRGIH